MSKRALHAQYQQAKQRLGEAEAKVIEVSAQRLNDLLRRTPIEQLRAIDEPDLTASDRKKLRLALRSSLRRSNGSALKWRAVRGWRKVSHATAANLVSLIIVLLISIPAFTALFGIWKNTAALVIIPQAMVLRWQSPSGEQSSWILPEGQKMGLIRKLDGSSYLRWWKPGQGYATSPVTVD